LYVGLMMEDLPVEGKMVENILKVWDNANERDITNGTSWYENTLELCSQLAEMFDYPAANVVGAYAVISPALDKEMNDKAIMKMMPVHKAGLDFEQWCKVGTYGKRNRAKAYQCLSGDLSYVRGEKVTAFFNNILGLPQRPTVDRWAVRVALLDPTLNGDKIAVGSKKVYNQIADAYIAAAKERGVTPAVMQAVTWESYRNKHYGAGKRGDTAKLHGEKYEKLRKDIGLQ
jgi:hypothetical protein